MTKNQHTISRLPPERTLDKQEAVRHLIHAATRMLAAKEDPFAIHVLIQSADKLLIDLSRKLGRPVPFNWEQFIKPQYRKTFLEIHRETFNFFKHADGLHLVPKTQS